MQIETVIRLCSTCKRPLPFNGQGFQEGFLCCEEYYCSQRCLDKSMEAAGTSWDEHFDEDGDCYFSEWELEEWENAA